MMKLLKKAKARFRAPKGFQNLSSPGPQGSSGGERLSKDDIRDSVWEGVKTALRLIKDSADAFPPLKSTVSGLLGIIDIVENTRSNTEEAGRILSTLSAMITVLKTSALKSLDSCGDASRRMDDLVASIDEKILLLRGISDRSRLGAFANVTKDKEEIGTVVRRISDLLNVFLIETCLATETISAETFDFVSKAYLRDELKPVYEAFHTADGPVPRHLCTPKTRAEILSAMISWATSADDSRIYCLSGMAGTGKTTIVNTLCRILERSRLLGGSFFCSRADTDCSSANRIIPSIVYQLATRFPSFRSEIMKALESMEKGSAERSFQQLLVEPLKACTPEIGSQVIVVIDALDECGNESHVGNLLSHLWTYAPSLPVKFLITFRPDRVFQSRLHLSDISSTKLHLHDVEESLVERDIRLFLVERLRQLAASQRERGIDVDDSWPTEAEFNALHSQSGKLFIYAATSCEYIGSGGTVAERLSQVLRMGHHPTPLQASSIDRLYTSILDEANEQLEQTEKDRLLRILSAVIYTQKSLTVLSLSTLLSCGVQEILASLDRLHSVLHFRPHDDDKVVSTLHASFPDYLGDPERSRGYFCDLVLGNTMLTHACLSTMDILKENICGLTEDTIPEHIDPQRIPESLQYACQFWPAHYHSSGFSEGLVSKLNNFLSSHVLHWVECVSLLGVLYPSISALQIFEIGASRIDPNIQSVLYDIRRFITQSIDLLKSNPLETYKSALVWLPTESYIRKTYCCGSRLPNIVCGLPKYWDSCEMVLTGHSLSVWSAAFSPDSSRIVSGSEDTTVRVWNSTTGELEHELTGHFGWIRSVAFSPDGCRIASASDDRTVRVWNLESGEAEHKLDDHYGHVKSVIFSPDGSRIVSGSDDETIRVWNLGAGELEYELTGHSSWINSIAFSPDGSYIASGSRDGIVRVWNSGTGELKYELTGHSKWISIVVFSPDGSHIASGSNDKTIRMWNLANGESEYELTGHSSWMSSIVFSPDGSCIASSCDDNTTRVWNSATGELKHKLAGHSKWISSVVFSPDGSHIASGSGDGTVCLWNSETGGLERELTGHSENVMSVTFSPDGSRIVSSSADKTIRVWNLSTREPRHELSGQSQDTAFSPDSSHTITGSSGVTGRVWNSATGENQDEATGHSKLIRCVAFSPDGSRIVSGSDDTTIRVWNSVTGELQHELIGHSKGICSVEFSPNGSHIVSDSDDNTIRVWDTATGASEVVTTTFVLPDQTVIHSQPRGRYLITPKNQGVAPPPALCSLSSDDQWLVVSSMQSKFWIPPSYYQRYFTCKFFDNMAVLGYITGRLIIIVVDK